MNRIEKKETAPDAAKLFEQEVRELKPDIPRSELCDMVDDYIYYQTDDMSREEAHAIVSETCRALPPPRAPTAESPRKRHKAAGPRAI